MPRPPLNERKEKSHFCEGNCGTVLPPSALRFCAPCRDEQDIPSDRRLPRFRLKGEDA